MKLAALFIILANPALSGSLDDPEALTDECTRPIQTEAEYTAKVYGEGDFYDLYLGLREHRCGDVSAMDELAYDSLFKPKACDTVGGDAECLRRVFNGSQVSAVPLSPSWAFMLGGLALMRRFKR